MRMLAFTFILAFISTMGASARELHQNHPGSPLSSSLSAWLAGTEWTITESSAFPAIPAPDGKSLWPLYIELTDHLAGTVTRAGDGRSSSANEWSRWSGTADRLHWNLLTRATSEQEIELILHVSADRNGPVSVRMGFEAIVAGWSYFHGLDHAVKLDAKSQIILAQNELIPEFKAPTQPLGIIADDNSILAVSFDPLEPRSYSIHIDAPRNFFGLVASAALTDSTLKFPRQATFAIRLWHEKKDTSGRSPMRQALDKHYRSHSSIYHNRNDLVGAWAPFSDAGLLPGRQDFGPLLNVLPSGSKLAAGSHDRVALLYTEPWYDWIPWPENKSRHPQLIENILDERAESGTESERWLALSTRHGMARNIDYLPVHVFVDTPWNQGVRLAVSPDPDQHINQPDIANRAGLEKYIIDAHFMDTNWHGVFLDSIVGLRHRDYNEAALAAADFPPLSDRQDLMPFVSGVFSALEWLSYLRNNHSSNPPVLVGNGALASGAFLSGYLDGFAEEIYLADDGLLDSLTGRRAEAMRITAGPRLITTGLLADFNAITRNDLEHYFRAALRFGFMPGLHSENGFHNMYWRNASWYHRDRPLFKKYMPTLERFARAGWTPQTSAATDTPGLLIESFGSGRDTTLLSLHNQNATPIRGKINFDLQAPLIVLRPIKGWIQVIHEGDPVTYHANLLPGETDALIAFSPEALLKEQQRHAVDHVAGINVTSLIKEKNIGLTVDVTIPFPTLRGKDQQIDITFSNRSGMELRIANITLQGALRRRAASDASFRLLPGEQRLVSIRLRPGDYQNDSALDVSWTASAGETSILGRRLLQAAYWDEVDITEIEENATPHEHSTEPFNLMLDENVQIATSGTDPDYRVDRLRNQITSSEGKPWPETSWRSIRRMDEHRIEIQLPRPAMIDNISIYWGSDALRPYPSSLISIYLHHVEGPEFLAGSYSPQNSDLTTTIPIKSEMPVTRVVIVQPPLSGSPNFPMSVWINELELIGSYPP